MASGKTEKLWHDHLCLSVSLCVCVCVCVCLSVTVSVGLYRVSFYKLQVDGNGVWQKQKSSGVIICPGTGSTSWHLNVNHVTYQKVHDILTVGKRQQTTS